MNKELYRAERELYYMVIELIRQFYSEPRDFRTMTQNGDMRFVTFSNAGIVEQDVLLPDGTTRHRRPVFDIQVSAEKQSPFSRAAQNETVKELYGMGLFQPENAIPALVCIDALDFEGKDKIRQQIQENAVMLQQFQAAMGIIQQVAAVDPMVAQMAAQAGLIDPNQMAMAAPQQAASPQPQQGRPAPDDGTAEERAARGISRTDNSMATKARLKAANLSEPR